MAATIGIVPAAGTGSRMWPYRAAKELIQVGYATVDEAGPDRIVPKAAIEHVLTAMRRGGVEDVLLVLSPVKWEVFRYLGPGDHLGLRLAYVCQEEPRGMPHALDQAYPFTRDRTVCMGMPDTIVAPTDCFAQLLALHEQRQADLTLGVFDTSEPHALAPVLLDARTGRVVDIVDKPEVPPIANTWGIAAWSPAFADLLHSFVERQARGEGAEMLLSDAFMEAVRAGLSVYGVPFTPSEYHDIGTPANLVRTRAQFEGAQRHTVAG